MFYISQAHKYATTYPVYNAICKESCTLAERVIKVCRDALGECIRANRAAQSLHSAAGSSFAGTVAIPAQALPYTYSLPDTVEIPRASNPINKERAEL